MDSDTRNTSELLHKLKIDRQAREEPAGISTKSALILAFLMTALGIAIGYGVAPDTHEQSTTQRSVSAAPAKAPSQTAQSDTPLPKTTESNAGTAVLNASGYITPRLVATVSAEVMGLIRTVEVEEGMAVTKDQVLARLDDTIASVSLKQAEANVSAAKSRLASRDAVLEEAQRQARRASENKYSSELEKTQAVTNLATAKANRAGALADLQSAQYEAQRRAEILDDHTIRAPFSGVVTVKNAQPGEIVAPSSAGGGFTRTGICTIVDMDSLEIEVDVNESFIGRVSAQQKVEAKLDAYPDWTIPASVIAIIPTADRGKATVRVRIQINVKDTRILPDMGVKVAFY